MFRKAKKKKQRWSILLHKLFITLENYKIIAIHLNVENKFKIYEPLQQGTIALCWIAEGFSNLQSAKIVDWEWCLSDPIQWTLFSFNWINGTVYSPISIDASK